VKNICLKLFGKLGITLSLMLFATLALPNAANTRINNQVTLSYDFVQSVGATPVPFSTSTTKEIIVNSVTNASLIVGSFRPQANVGYTIEQGFGALGGNVNNQTAMQNPTYLAGANAGGSIGDIGDVIEQKSFNIGNTIFFKLTDFDQNKDSLVAESITVNITIPNGDTETIFLKESGLNTGIFYGYINTARGPLSIGSTSLEISNNEILTVRYQDNGNNQDIAVKNIRANPASYLFNSINGQRINGVTVRLLDATTGNAATVFDDDGVTPFPNEIVSGTSFTSAAGITYNFSPGEFRFPVIPDGSYRLELINLGAFNYPSTLSDASINSNSSNQFFLDLGSKAQNFTISSNTLSFDIPLDSTATALVDVSKAASKITLGVGEFVKYTISINNRSSSTQNNVLVNDLLPKGFIYQKNTAKINNIDISNLSFNFDGLKFNNISLPPNSTTNITYVVQVTQNASIGNNINSAFVLFNGQKSNTATAKVFVEDDLLTNRNIVIGEVYYANTCSDKKPAKNIRLIFNTGDYVVSDDMGRWHIDALPSGTNVLRIDNTLMKDFEIVSCDYKTGEMKPSDNSVFIDNTPGSIKKSVFILRDKREVNKEPLIKVENNLYNIDTTNLVVKKVKKDTRETLDSGTEALSKHEEFKRVANENSGFLFPDKSFTPSTLAVGLAIAHTKEEFVSIEVAGKEISKFNFDGIREADNSNTMITYFRGVPILEGKNKITAVLKDSAGNIKRKFDKDISFNSEVAKVIFLPDSSILSADGKSEVIIAARFLNKDNEPIHKGFSGNYNLIGTLTPFIDREDGQSLDLITQDRGAKNTFFVSDSGVAYIKFNPTENSGENLLEFDLYDGKKAIIRPWINIAQREWIMVGIANLNSSKLKKDESLPMEVIESGGRISFYGKGSIDEKTLLTIAYDSAKKKPKDFSEQLIGSLEEIYPIYSDQTFAKKDALSQSKLYVRIDRKKFYALFGYFNTEFNYFELSSYNKSLNGFKSHYIGDKFSSKVFVAKSNQLQQEEEFSVAQSGILINTKNAIVEGSETVEVITRDRFSNRSVLNRIILNRYVDYDISYVSGSIVLKSTVLPTDAGFNPNFIKVSYSTFSDIENVLNAGLRLEYSLNENTKVGVTQITDKNTTSGQTNNLNTVDLEYTKDSLKIRAEVGLSNNIIDNTQSDSGYSFSVENQTGNHNYNIFAKKIGLNYGLPNNILSETGIEKSGIKYKYTLTEESSIESSIINQKDLQSDISADTKDIYYLSSNDLFDYRVGLKAAIVNNINYKSVLGGLSWKYNERITFNVGVEKSNNEDEVVPSRIALGVDYLLNEKTSLLYQSEYLVFKQNGENKNVNIQKVGLQYKPFNNTQIGGFVGADIADRNNYVQFNGTQKFQVTDNLAVDFLYSQQKWDRPITNTASPFSIVTKENYKIFGVGSSYRFNDYFLQNKVELKKSQTNDSILLQNTLYKKNFDGFNYSLTANYLKNENKVLVDQSDELFTIGAGWSYRNMDSDIAILGKVNYIDEDINNIKTKKIVNNNHINIYNGKNETSLGLSVKYVIDTIDNQQFKGLSFVASLSHEIKIYSDFGLGVVGTYGFTNPSSDKSLGLGVFGTYYITKDARLSLGYQKIRQYNENFNFDQNYQKGLYFKIDVKFDELSFKNEK